MGDQGALFMWDGMPSYVRVSYGEETRTYDAPSVEGDEVEWDETLALERLAYWMRRHLRGEPDMRRGTGWITAYVMDFRKKSEVMNPVVKIEDKNGEPQ